MAYFSVAMLLWKARKDNTDTDYWLAPLPYKGL